MINIPLDVDVQCTDGLVGKTSSVIVHRETLQATQFVIKGKAAPHTERLVPIEYVKETTADHVFLNCTIDELQKMQEFVVTTYHQLEMIHYASAAYGAYPYYYRMPELETVEVQQEQVPAGEVSIRSGMEVLANDGKVGRVVSLLEDKESGKIAHFVLREARLWGKRDIIVPVSFVNYVDNRNIHLKIDKETITAMLAVPARSQVDLTEMALVAVIFPETGKAKDFLDSLTETTAIRFSNAAVLVKESNGKTSIRETRDVDKGRGAIFGAITGGLVGMLGGPVGAIVGAMAGAATGRAAAKRIDLGFPDEYLQKLQKELQAGSSALIVLVEKGQTLEMSRTALDFGGKFILQDLTQDILTRIASINRT